MRLSAERIQSLQRLLSEEFGLEYDYEQAQQAGLAIMRFVLAKEQIVAKDKKGKYGSNKFSNAEIPKTGAGDTTS